MTRPQSSPILAQLRGAKTFSEQTAALRALKNEIVGHVQRKEEWVAVGVLEPIVRTLAATRSPLRANGRDTRQPAATRTLSDEESVKLQALQLIGSFAMGGPAFLPPLNAAMALPAILNNISPASAPTQIIIAALQAINTIADAASLASPSCTFNLEAIANQVFTPQHIESLSIMLASSTTQELPSPIARRNSLATAIISRLCCEERHQQALAAGGVLDLLATQLGSIAVRDGFVVPDAVLAAGTDAVYQALPTPAHRSAEIGPVLEAIGAVIGDSKYRATCLVNSPSILAVFPSIKARRVPNVEVDRTQGSDTPFRPPWLTAMEYLLPSVVIPLSQNDMPVPHSRADHSETKSIRKGKNGFQIPEVSPFHVPGFNGSYPTSEIESPLIPWLVYLGRALDEVASLAALAILASLFRAGLCMTVARETTLGLLAVPVLLNSIEKSDNESTDTAEFEDVDKSKALTRRFVLERGPVILARLITDCQTLQKAAFDCDAIKRLTRVLKNTYRPLPPTQAQYWSPHADERMEVERASPVYRLGDDGVHPVMAHRVRTREAVFKAIGAIAACEESYRKALAVEDIVPYIVESLCEFPGKPRKAQDHKDKNVAGPARTSPDPDYGTNPVGVIISACFVTRVLSRSVHSSRTALIDNNVAAPVLSAMKHPDINVQIAATAAVSNLVVSVSPSKEYLAEHGLMKLLCEHAHSPNRALQLNALWGLKHFVDGVSASMRKTCLEQLEPGWLMQLIGGEEQDEMMHASRMGDDLDEEMDGEPLDSRPQWSYASGGSIRVLSASGSPRLREIEGYLSRVRDAESNPVPKALNDITAVQEQALDFIRNLIGRVDGGDGADSSTANPEVIDYLFKSLGQEHLFDTLASKLRSRVLRPFARRASGSGRESKIMHPNARIVVAVIYSLAHIAATGPRYCQLIVAQTELLELLVPHANSKDSAVRLALCRLLYNLITKDNGTESHGCAQRAAELKRLGFGSRVEAMMKQDRDLNVRENARVAAWLIENPAA
ncbi:Armadillo-type fold domain containing protein [Cordyceps fumosorosea ARSEF 2679]|uniref:Armadillo-type fold domain containing protein n=1 Tax=Cordyceps fumosorosea (strain ARSEF 2679) TaxID=1081104 RepID=A0A162JKW5_CORFA|nr:Armadillo-type fold domain containing protein [Cordyceps fumosorosea ARSEF 2679]OAA70472.1 Armadillo-type fold domain containing protein [Cordyceps fumosorosea ARSEF 2679]